MTLIGMPLKNVCNSIIKNHLTFSILMCTNFKIMEKSLSFSLKTSILIPFHRTSKTICRWFQSKKQKLFLRLPFKIKAFLASLNQTWFIVFVLAFPNFIIISWNHEYLILVCVSHLYSLPWTLSCTAALTGWVTLLLEAEHTERVSRWKR